MACPEPGEDPMSTFGDGTSAVLKYPNLASVRVRTSVASSGSGTFHFRANTLIMLKARRAQSQSSAISSRCLAPCIMSLLEFFSGRLRRCMVHAEWTI